MADSLYRVNRGITLNPQSSAPANPTNGDIYYDSTQGTFVFYDNGFWINLASRQDVASAASLTSANFTAAIVANSLIRITGATASTIHGITASTDGNIAVIYNNTNQLITVAHQSGSEATAANRIVTHTAQSIVIPAGMTMKLVYDGSQSRWVFMADAIDGVDKLFEDRNVLLTQGGLITYTGTQVQFTEALKIDVNQREAGGAPVVIDLGSTTRNVSASGRMIYAVIDRVAGTAVVTDDATSLPAAVPLNQEVFLIAKRVDAGDGTKRLYWRNGAALNEGQSARLGASGLTLLASRALVSDSSGNIAASSVTATELGYVSGVTSAIQTQLDAKVPKTLTTTTGDMIYASSANTPARLAIGSSGQVLKTVGGIPTWATFSGGINYLSANPDAESDTSGWATYADAAGTSPVDGTGGSPTTTWTRSTSSPLRGSGSFILTKDAANRQGEGASYAFTIDSADQAKIISVTFDYTVGSGTYATGDVTAYIYDVTNALVIQPTGYQIESASTGLGMKHVATFQTASNSTSYRLILHVASTSASAYTVKCDNFAVSPQVITQGTPVTDWQAYTPTGSFTNNTTYTGQWRRVGDVMEVSARVTFSGAPNSTTFSINLPSGYSIDSTKLSSSTSSTSGQPLGQITVYDGTLSGDGTVAGSLFYSTTTSVLGSVALYSSASNNALAQITQAAPLTIGSGTKINLQFQVPISGWSSQVQMSSDTDTRVVEAILNSTATSISDGGTSTLSFSSAESDTHGGWNSGTTYTIPVSGYYEFLGFGALSVGTNTAAYFVLEVFKNGSTTNIQGRYDGNTSSQSTILGATLAGKIKCNAGDTITLKGTQASGASRTPVVLRFQISRDCGPSQIAASETVAAKAYPSSASQTVSSGATTTITTAWNTLGDSSHGTAIFDTSTGKFTAPVSGRYRVSHALRLTPSGNWGIGNQANSYIQKGGSTVVGAGGFHVALYVGANDILLEGNDTVRLLAGEYIQIAVFNNGPSLSVANADNSTSHFTVERVGNY